MRVLPQYENLEIEQITKEAFGGTVTYHLYPVEGFPCGHCANCAPKPRKNPKTGKLSNPKPKPCEGLPSVTSFSGQYGGGGLYPAGYRHALDAVFGAYADEEKTEVKEDSWFSDYLRSGFQSKTSVAHNKYRHYMSPEDILRFRQEVEEIPTPGKVSSEFGVGVHAALESVLTGEGEVPVKYADAVDAVMGWLNKGGPDGPYVVEDVEVNVFHPELLYAGQIDCVARCGNRVIIIDWKSGRGIYDSHAMQVAAYAMAYEAMTGEAVAEAWVVQSGRHGFAAKRVRNLIPAQKAFIAIQEAKRNVRFIDWDEE